MTPRLIGQVIISHRERMRRTSQPMHCDEPDATHAINANLSHLNTVSAPQTEFQNLTFVEYVILADVMSAFGETLQHRAIVGL